MHYHIATHILNPEHIKKNMTEKLNFHACETLKFTMYVKY